MNFIQAYKDEKYVGRVANILSIGLLGKTIVGVLDFRHNTIGHYIFYGVIFINLIFLLLSTRTLKREGTQTKLSVIGKTFALLWSLLFLVLNIINKTPLNSSDILDILFASLIIIFVPCSFYLFRKKNETLKLSSQKEECGLSDFEKTVKKSYGKWSGIIRLICGIVISLFGILFFASADKNAQGPAGSIIIGFLCLAAGSTMIFFGARYLSRRKKKITEFALQMLRTDGKINASKLAQSLGISEVEIKKHLAHVQKEGILPFHADIFVHSKPSLEE